jgi:hypothetical protein
LKTRSAVCSQRDASGNPRRQVRFFVEGEE